MMGLSHLQCCSGIRNKCLSRRDSDGWRTSIEVPSSSLSTQRRSKLADDYKYNDGEIQIDRTGLHILHGGHGPAHRGSGWADMLKASRSFTEHDDDCLSVASTEVADDVSEAGSIRSSRSLDSRQKGERSHGLSPSANLSNCHLPGCVDPRKKTNKRPVKFENISKVCVIGKGTSGLVWRCIDKSNRDPLALKEVLFDDDEEKTKMAVRELVTMYGVNHSGVVTCHEVFYSRGSFQMVLEYMDGGSLLDAMRRSRDDGGPNGELSASALTVIGYSVASALEMLHEVLEVVHRDVKPGNILLTSYGQVKLADLGICTHPGTVQDGEGDAGSGGEACCETPATEWIGTLTYMSPERLVGDAYSFKADIWSLGMVLVEAAIGRYPVAGFDGEASLQFWDLLDRVLSDPCPSRQMNSLGAEWEGLRRIAAACLDKDPKERPRARDLKMNEVLMGGESDVLAEWVCRHLPFLALEGKVGKSEPLKESEMWT